MGTLSACGLYDCECCDIRANGSCPGCHEGNALLIAWGRPPCTIAACVQERGIPSCKACSNTVCTLLDSVEGLCPLRSGAESKAHWMWRIAQYLKTRSTPCAAHSPVPVRTLMRLRWYISALESMSRQGIEVVSSRELAEKVGIGAAMVRRDFSHFGVPGRPGIGYAVPGLVDRFHEILEKHACQVVWIGAAWLTNALSTISENLDLNFRVVAAFDTRPEWVGKTVGPWVVRPLTELAEFVSTASVHGAVLAMADDPEGVAEAVVRAGVRGILNLTPVTLAVPPDVSVRHVDLVGEMMALAESMNPNS